MDFIVDVFEKNKLYFKTQMQMYQFFDKYSRYDYNKGRRETYPETTGRAVDYLREISDNKLKDSVYKEIENAILNMEVMPSMRLLASAGKAARRYNQSIYNCAFTAIDSIESFVEILNISMNGVGMGFSVEKRFVEKLPRINKKDKPKIINYKIEDSTEGWCSALEFGIKQWFKGNDVLFDYSAIRPAGSVLKTKGGRASGHKPLKNLLEFIRYKILNNENEKLTTLDAYDIVCKLGDCVVCGGHRRTAFLCLFDYDDNLMLQCKSRENIAGNEHRYNSNNSVVLPERKLTQKEVLQFLMSMDKDGNGEPGIFSRLAIKNTLPDTRIYNKNFGLNPCGEIVLLIRQFCNLSSVVCRKNDTLESLKRKVRIATIIGTIQSISTDFKGLNPKWKFNCEQERLLGVDLNGQMDCEEVRKASTLKELRKTAIETNKEYAELLGINRASAITTVKPSGNSGVLLNTSSGIHPRWSQYYVRNIRVSRTSPLYRVLKESGVKLTPENNYTEETASNFVVGFPIKSPDNCITRHDLSAIKQLNYWENVALNWSQHNVSATIYYDPDEILDVANWIYKKQDILCGITFLPKFDSSYYPQAPYVEIAKEEYEKLNAEFPTIDFSLLQQFEDEDLTEASKELACTAGFCDLQL